MKFEGPTITGFGGELIVLLFTTGAFVAFGGGDGDDVFTTGGDDVDWPKDGDCGDDGDDVEGGDSDDVSWPVDGLYCATAILIQLAIATILIAIIEEIKMTLIAFWLIKII
jgi:hypothetical protein